MNKSKAVEKLLNLARAEIGYREKASAKALDDPSANAGSKNYTKYARDLDAQKGFYNGRKQGYAWCDVFVDWCFSQAFGTDSGRRMLCQPERSLGAGTGYSAGYFKSVGRWHDKPEPGDQVFFRDGKGAICHTGLVEAVTADRLTTIEGNAGDRVIRGVYPVNAARIAGYGRPRWELATEDAPESAVSESAPVPQAEPDEGHPTLSKGSRGSAVRDLQKRLEAMGYALPRWGVDGDFGQETERAVRLFQQVNSLEVDGIVGPKTWAKLADSTARMIEPDPNILRYTVKKGDTLIRIAVAHGTTAQSLAILNGIAAPYVIYPGQELRIFR